jgi:SagB-type dehydrogenase family enzyme
VAYDEVFGGAVSPVPLGPAFVGDLLRHSLGLSAWKQWGSSRWSLRVNPSSGNLHPTEAYAIFGPDAGVVDSAAVCHYAADSHALELRCRFDGSAWTMVSQGHPLVLLILTSIHWREAWKYGERAFRYCQHDLGHAIGAVAVAAAMLGWRAVMLPSWSDRDIAGLSGIDRDDDFVEAEREEPGCVLAIAPSDVAAPAPDPAALRDAARTGEWSGRASQLSVDHVQWSFIDDVAQATEDHGRERREGREGQEGSARGHASARTENPSASIGVSSRRGWGPAASGEKEAPGPIKDARSLVLQRRSAVAFDPGSPHLDADRFFAMLARVMPVDGPPWDALWWPPRIHLVLFVHRVDGIVPGMYALGREPDGFARLQAALGAHLLREPAHAELPFVRLFAGDHQRMARLVSCDQAIASDGFFSLGMIADFDASLIEFGPSFYRRLFWESGVLGQVLYLEAEAAGVRATGIGCFYDDAVHDMLGLAGHAFQSLYHFTVGAAIDDARLTTAPGYAWESC